MKSMDTLPIRLLFAAFIGYKVFDVSFATLLTFAYSVGSSASAQSLGQLTPGDDYQRLIPLMEGIPLWLHGLMILAGAFYLVAVVSVLRGAAWAYLPMLGGFAFEALATILVRPIIQAIGVAANPNPSVVASIVIPYLLPLSLALLLWLLFRPTTRKPASY